MTMLSLNLRAKRRRVHPQILIAILSVIFSTFAWGTFILAQSAPYLTELVGNSVQGRPITAYRFGNGPTRIAFIGGIHQGDESNSTDLIEKAVEYYGQHPNAIPRDLTVIFIPKVNPDGYTLKQRFNSRGVDLNRNWPTADWKSDTYDVDGLIKGGGGKTPLSEPENIALWNYIQANGIIGTIWYHSQGGMVVDTMPTANGRRVATGLARSLAASTGYTYKDVWTEYPISGDVGDFLNSKGIYSLTVELNTHTDTDWTPNLRGFSSVISFFTTHFSPQTGKSVSGQLLAYWATNGGVETMGNPLGEQQADNNRIWQQFEKGTLTLDLASGMVGWLQGATQPAPNAAAILQARPPLQIVPLPDLGTSSVVPVDSKSAGVRDAIKRLQQQATDVQKDFLRINEKLGNLPLNTPPPDPDIRVIMPEIGLPPQNIQPPSGDLDKAIKVVLGPNSTAGVYAYERGKLVRSIAAFSGKVGHETPHGDFKIHYKNPRLQTNRWYEDDGTEYILKNFASFTGPSLRYSDDWAFHQMRIPVSGPQAGHIQPGPSHGCLALSPEDAAWIYNWASEGTPVSIY